MTENNEIIKTSSGENSEGKSVIPYSFGTAKITKTNCRLCQVEYREEVEQWYEEQPRKNFTAIKNRIKQEKGDEISLPAIKNHLVLHYDVVKKNEILQEYAEDLQKWVETQGNKVTSLKARTAALEREMMMLVSQGESLVGDERRKNSEMVRKLSETILLHQTKMDEMEEDLKPVGIVFNQLQIIVTNELKENNNLMLKKTILRIVEKLKDAVGDLYAE